MRSPTRRFALLLGLTLVLPLLPLGAATPLSRPAQAAAPEIDTVDETYVDPYVSALCGATVEVHVEGRILFREQGNTQYVNGADYRATYTNTETGQTVVVRTGGLVSFTYDPETGEQSSFFNGITTNAVAPGKGAYQYEAGRFGFVIAFDPELGEYTFTLVTDGNAGDYFEQEDFIAAALCS